jgi:alpha-glucosidase
LLDQYPETTMVGEIGSDDPFATIAEYTSGNNKLQMAYLFNLLTAEFSTKRIRDVVEELEARIGDGWPCWSFSNHDVMRVMTRWGGANPAQELAKVLLAMLSAMRGSICIYQGEELGLTEADIPFEKLQDPYGISFWPDFKGRDGCRTPMPWTARGKFGGFSTAEPWLPVPEEHLQRAVDVQEASPASVLNACRQFLVWRRQHPALKRGSIRFVDAPDNAIAFVREHEDESILAAFNFSREPVSLPSSLKVTPLSGHGFTGRWSQRQIDLGPYDAFFGKTKP